MGLRNQMINNCSNVRSLSQAEKRASRQKRRNNQTSIYSAVSTLPVKAICIAKVLLTKWPAYVCAPVRSDLLQEPRIPNNGLVVKLQSQKHPGVPWFRMGLVAAMVPEAHQQRLNVPRGDGI